MEEAALERVAAWTDGYAPLPGIPDEFVGPDGVRRQHWEKLLLALAAHEPGEIAQRFAAADRRIRNRGMSYRVQGETSERVWPLSRMPLVIPEAEWRVISHGVAQRAELLERLLADLYCEGRLVAEGVLPAAALTGSADYIGAMRGVKPPGKRWLRLYAADIGRGPDGRWWVLGDRAQAPSGSGYALENRLVISQAFSSLYSQMNVERLAPFFRELRAGLKAAGQRTEPRIGILTPGPLSATYFEQAYLARYLGFLLVEGDDLVTRDGRVFVRTIAGLKLCDVLWRHVDAEWCDPLELNAASRIGVPGLIDAIRAGGVAVENMPGAGLIESRALLAFLPALARRLIGEDLAMPNIATWWCGQPGERAKVLAALDGISIAPAFGDTAPGLRGKRGVVGAELSARERDALRAAIETRGVDYVGQDLVRLSTTPRWEQGRLVPRPFVLRVYVAATPDGWRVMPGGFCRISDKLDARAVSMGEGVESADVWVLADRPVEATSLLPTPEKVRILRMLGNLPSRAADNLFWFGRYLEREEATLRLIRCLSAHAVDPDAPMNSSRDSIERLRSVLVAWGAIDPESLSRASAATGEAALRDEEQYGSALSIARAARYAASVIRERLTQQTWQLIGRLETVIREAPARPLVESEIIDCVDEALGAIAALAGLFDENFNRGAGWIFYELGRRIERGINTCRLARQFAGDDATEYTLDVLLDLIDSQITYRSRTLIGVALAPVRDMALLDPFNPRSVAFQANLIDDHIGALPVLRQDGVPEEPKRLATLLRAELAAQYAERLDESGILVVEQRLMTLAEAIAARYFLQGASHVRAEKVTGLA
ncbi:MAG: circularly permuted type 2 ATP-grasp protein [Hyphomicrobiales bacterium]|nr:circularly permuted type 2 ATP-grasp protein [Hyphomicrobiales bacterium]